MDDYACRGTMTGCGFQHVEDQNDCYLAPALDEIADIDEEGKKVYGICVRL